MIASLAIAISLLGATDRAAQSRLVSAETIEQVAHEGLRSQLDAMGSHAGVTILGRTQDQHGLPDGEVAVEMGAIGGRLPRSRVGVPVRLLVDGRLVRTVTVWVGVEDKREVLTYAADHSARMRGGALALRPAIVDMACCAGEAVIAAEELQELRTVHAVKAGQPVMRSDFEAMPAVSARDRVDIEVANGSVRLTTAGVALHDGGLGERIQVRPDHASEAIQSRVVGRQKVRVE